MKSMKNAIWGVVLVLAGVLLVLNGFGVVDFELFFDGWWTLLIIIPCLNGLLFDRDKLGNLIGLMVGALLLLWRLELIPSRMIWVILVASVLVGIGIKLIFGDLLHRSSRPKIKFKKGKNKSEGGCAVFAGCDMDYNGKVFEGADLVAVFGGVECDLRQAIIEKDCEIDAVAVFGGIDILVPPHVNVRTNAFSIFGGTDDLTSSEASDRVTIHINSVCVFGGIDVKH